MEERILKQEPIAGAGNDGGTFDIYYDPENGNVRVEGTGFSSLEPFKNGNWTKTADNVTQAEKDRVYAIIQSAVRNAHKAWGGNAKQFVLPPWAATQSQPVAPDPSTAFSIGNLTNNLLGSVAGFDLSLLKLDPDKIEKSLKFGEVDKYIKITEQYPLDALYGKNKTTGKGGQDYIQITQYKYKPPRRETFFEKDAPSKILKGGIQRGSSFSKEEFIGLVKLPMPNDISDSNNVNWGEDAMNNLSAAITSAVLQNPGQVAVPSITGSTIGGLAGIPGLGSMGMLLGLLRTAGIDLKDNPNAQAIIAPTVASRILAMGQIQVSPESILARGFGIAPNSNLELLFQSPTLREFNFNWKMSPRSEPEAVKIRKIIRFFKQGMAAKKLDGAAGAGSFFLGTPNVFQVEYKTSNNSAIAGLNRIKTCALTGTSVNYTPEGDWASYGDGQPVSIILSLRFQELEPVYDTDYNENVSTDRIDLYPIRPDEVGY